MLNNEYENVRHIASRFSAIAVAFCLATLACFSMSAKAQSGFTPTNAQLSMHKNVIHDSKILRSLHLFPLEQIVQDQKSYWVMGITKYFDKDHTITINGKPIEFRGILNIKAQLSPVHPKPYGTLRYIRPQKTGGISGPYPGGIVLDGLRRNNRLMVCKVVGNPSGVIDFSNVDSYVMWVPNRYKEDVVAAIKYARSHQAMFSGATGWDKKAKLHIYPAKTLTILNGLLSSKNIFLATWACKRLLGIGRMDAKKFMNGPFKTAQGYYKAYIVYVALNDNLGDRFKHAIVAALLTKIRTAHSAAEIREIALGTLGIIEVSRGHGLFGKLTVKAVEDFDANQTRLINAISKKEKSFNSNTKDDRYVKAILNYGRVEVWLDNHPETPQSQDQDSLIKIKPGGPSLP